MHKVPPEHQEALFYSEIDQALAQVSHRGCGVFLLSDIQKLSGYGPGEPPLGGLA